MSYDTLRVALTSGVEVENWSKHAAALMPVLERELRIANPKHAAAVRGGRWTGNIPEFIDGWRYDPARDVMTVPLTFLDRLRERTGLRVLLEDLRAEPTPERAPVSAMVPWDYQVPAIAAIVEALERVGYALFVAAAGSGKTTIGLEVAALMGVRTLWMVHTEDLADQAFDRAVEGLGLDPDDIGFLGAGKRKIGDFLTVGLLQTLDRMDLDEHTDTWGLVIMDEAHRAPCDMAMRVREKLRPRYILGLTATPKRKDRLEPVMFWHFGRPAYTVPRSATKLMTPDLYRIETDTVVPAWREWEEECERVMREAAQARGVSIDDVERPAIPDQVYTKVLDEILADEERNERLADLLAAECPGRHSLVLSARVEHCELLASMLAERRPDLVVEVIHGKVKKSVRRDMLRRARAGEIDVLLGVNIPKEGLDVPILDQGFLVAPSSNETYVEQAVGRIQRVREGKPTPRWWDVVDEQMRTFAGQYKTRRRVYRRLGMRESARPTKRAEALLPI